MKIDLADRVNKLKAFKSEAFKEKKASISSSKANG